MEFSSNQLLLILDRICKYFHILIQLFYIWLDTFMFGQVPEEQVEWTKEHIALQVDQFILWNKQMKLSLLNDKHNYSLLILLLVYQI